jgi:hypothetical protein
MTCTSATHADARRRLTPHNPEERSRRIGVVAVERAVVLGPSYAEDSNHPDIAAVRASAVALCGGGGEARVPGRPTAPGRRVMPTQR